MLKPKYRKKIMLLAPERGPMIKNTEIDKSNNEIFSKPRLYPPIYA